MQAGPAAPQNLGVNQQRGNFVNPALKNINIQNAQRPNNLVSW